MKIHPKKVKVIISVFWVLVFTCLFFTYLWFIIKNLTGFLDNFTNLFGYFDPQENWRALSDFVRGKVYFKDYFYEYGWFLLLLESISYLLLNQTFFAVMVARHFFLPLLGFVLAFVVGRNFLKKPYLIFLFLLLNLFHGSTTDFSPVRHLVAELGLSFLFIYLNTKQNKFLFLAGIISGLAVITALEYGFALNITIFIFSFFVLFFNIAKKRFFLPIFILGETIVLIPFSLYLFVEKALSNYIIFTTSVMSSFYYSSSCGGSFPRLKDIPILSASTQFSVFTIPIEFLRNLNMYIVLLFYVLIFVVLMFKYFKSKKFTYHQQLILLLVLYGSLIYVRTLDNPCIGYFRYGLIPFFLILVLLVSESISIAKRANSKIFKMIIILLASIGYGWFILTDNTGFITTFFSTKKVIPNVSVTQPKKSFYETAGWYIEDSFIKNYEQITQYIVKNTKSSDTVIVYPWGPYNNLTWRDAANSLQALHLVYPVDQRLIDRTIDEFESKKPKFAIINVYNNLSMASYGRKVDNVRRYLNVPTENGPVFSGEGKVFETYILKNYKTVFKNKVGIVMQRRKEPIDLPNLYKKIETLEKKNLKELKLIDIEKKDSSGTYKISSQGASMKFILKKPVKASDVVVQFTVDGDIFTKRLSRYVIQVKVDTNLDDEPSQTGYFLATKELQTSRVSIHEVRPIKSVFISVYDNYGLLWWLHPYEIKLKRITFESWLPLIK